MSLLDSMIMLLSAVGELHGAIFVAWAMSLTEQ